MKYTTQKYNLWNTHTKIHNTQEKEPPVFTRYNICAIHNVNTEYKYTMQIHNAVAQVAGVSHICQTENLWNMRLVSGRLDSGPLHNP